MTTTATAAPSWKFSPRAYPLSVSVGQKREISSLKINNILILIHAIRNKKVKECMVCN